VGQNKPDCFREWIAFINDELVEKIVQKKVGYKLASNF